MPPRRDVRAVRPLVYTYWGPEFEFWCRQENNCCGQCQHFFGEVYQGSPDSPFSSHQHSPLSISPLHVISDSHSFISCHHSLHSWLGKIICLAHHRCIIIGWCRGRSGMRTMCFFINLSLNEHHLGQNVSGKDLTFVFPEPGLGESGLGMADLLLRPRSEPSTGNMNPGECWWRLFRQWT